MAGTSVLKRHMSQMHHYVSDSFDWLSYATGEPCDGRADSSFV